MKGILSSPPRAKLIKAFSQPYDNAVATARTCYSSKVIYDSDVQGSEDARNLRDSIAKSTYLAGHHTTLQHAHFEFVFENVSRQALWSFFHAHPFYNSEQVSQRYVEVKPSRVLVPKFSSEKSQRRYEAAVTRQMTVYQELLALLYPSSQKAYFDTFKGRSKDSNNKRWQSDIKKKCQEVARYVLPVATHAHLYHTISGLTLHRYNRLASSYDCPIEQKLIVQSMVNEVAAHDPNFFKYGEDHLALEKTNEARFFDELFNKNTAHASHFVKEFDDSLAQKTAKLVSYTNNAPSVIGMAVRQIFGLPKSALSDKDALELALNPTKNRYLAEALNLNSLGKISRALELVQFTFQKKMSHTMDSQSQRHRMIPGSRPVLWTHVTPEKPDFILPKLFECDLATKAKALFIEEMNRLFEDIAYLVDDKTSPEGWQYLLPNAFPVRYFDSGTLLDLHHKWSTRLCYNAQEEIWRSCLDQVLEVEKVYPEISKWILPPCNHRLLASASPYCPENIRFCGVQVWKQQKSEYQRPLI